MKLLASLVGLTAETNAGLSRQSINAVPVNFIIMGGLLLASYFCGGMVVEDHIYLAALGFIPAFGLFGLMLASTLKLNTFFVPGPATAAAGAFAGPRDADNGAVLPAQLTYTGKLRLDPKSEQRFLNIPAVAARLDGGELAFASNIDASTRFYGAVTQSRVGIWLSLPDLREATFETGTLLCGKRPLAALRLRYEETSGQKRKKAVAILGFDSPADRDALQALLQAQTTTDGPLQSPRALS